MEWVFDGVGTQLISIVQIKEQLKFQQSFLRKK